MELEINDKKYVLRFGIGFVRKLNDIAGLNINSQGVVTSMGMSLNKTLPALKSGDPAALSDVLWAACQNLGNKNKPEREDIDQFLDDGADIDVLVEKVSAELLEANATKSAAKNLLS